MPVNDAGTQAALSAQVARIHAASQVIAVRGALMIQRAGMARTAVKSGTLRRSWRTERVDAGGTFGARIGPTTVYARRQELGFKGPDSLGRIFTHDLGKPYVKPAFVETMPQVKVYARTIWAKALKG